ncbi:amidase [Nocardioides sp. TF02-7]|uniref:amidase n=1 Tax=Nocardioides sp. TF02-7 TaxID=2917724 RepID=UPI001F055200|nr:amidase [Nocardioides sp. TF02-7]UMG93713.1 amidase [Nocardioides sp. TF02-7]
MKHPLAEGPRTITDARRALDRGEVTAVDLVERAAAGVAEHDRDLGIFLRTTLDTAAEAAARADERRAAGRVLGPLDGIPVVVKDIVFTADAPTTGQSLLRDATPTGDAPACTGLREAGAVFLGKTSTMEFALGFTDPEKPFPLPRNPWDRQRWTGGSSSGTASAVATGIALGGIGTDTAASIREPAAWCGITGLKPTHGLVSQEGVLPLAWSFDHVGPMARSAEDCALLLDAMTRHGSSGPATDPGAVPRSLRGLRVGVAVEPLERSSDAVRARMADAVAVLADAGAEVARCGCRTTTQPTTR